MKCFYVEGLFIGKQGARKTSKGGKGTRPDVEPFSQAIWANNAAEALQMANEAIASGQWIEGPSLSENSEEERMRQMGAPLLPGFDLQTKPARKKKG